MSIAKEYSITNLINDEQRFKSLKERLAGSKEGSDEYLFSLLEELPLNSWPEYKTFLKSQAVPVTDSIDAPDKSVVYRSSMSPNHLVTCVDHRLKTSYDHFAFTARMWPNNNCLGSRPYNSTKGEWEPFYQWESYEEVSQRAKNFGSGILSLVNMKVSKPLNKNGFIVAILSHNSPEWVITDLACQSYSLTNTSLYETLGPTTSEYIMNLVESPVLCFAKVNIYKILNILPELKFVNTLICLDETDEKKIETLSNSLLDGMENSKGERISLYSMKDVEKIGSMTNIPLIPPKPESLYTISFTSGTTGLPKGVEITQQIIASGIAFSLSTFKVPNHKKSQQLHDLCFLPLAHIFERQILAYDLSRGVGLGFLHKPDPTVLVEDLRILKPDCLALVPRILTRFEAGIKTNLSRTALQKNLSSNIIDSKTQRFASRGGTDRSIMNFLVYHRILIDKIRDGLGLTNTSYLVTGSAPISKETLLFLRSCLDIGIRQGYGLTESFAGICLSEPHERDPGSCGAIGITAECRLKDVPHMRYYAKKDLKGELQLRGPQVFKRYYKNEKASAEAIDDEGWFSTGDVASIDSKGRLYIIDRVKNFFKLAHGEYIAPEKIENIYLSSCPYVSQIFVYGDPLQTFLVGIVSIDVDGVQDLLEGTDPLIKTWDSETLIMNLNENVKLRRTLVNAINKCTDGLQGFEKVHNVFVGIDLLRVDNDTITPTFKIKRLQCTRYFKKQLDDLYKEGSMVKNSKL